MVFTYTWQVTGLRTKDEVNKEGAPLQDAVVQTYWKVTGTDEQGRTGSFSGATPFTAKDVPAGEFVSFSQLTEETVLSWIKAIVERDKPYKDHIDWRIQDEIDKEVVKDAKMPWAPDDVTPQAPLANATPAILDASAVPTEPAEPVNP
jgi:hypothetical protein